MNLAVRRYLAEIGARGGHRSRRRLSRVEALNMVRVREARRAYRTFYARCFWSFDKNLKITLHDIDWVAEQLMKNGDRIAWHKGASLCR